MNSNKIPKILVSACLLGNRVRYDGKDSLVSHKTLHDWYKRGCVMSICPEVAGGLPIPRAGATIHGDHSGLGVLQGTARIINIDKKDVTAQYLDGAKKTFELAHLHGIRVAILKENSPSCGRHYVYSAEGTTKLLGMGLTAAYLEAHGIRVFSENTIDEALCLAEQLFFACD